MEPRSEPRTRRPPVGSPVKVKKKSAKHTVKFKDQCDVREDVLVVTVEPPSPSPGSPEPTPPKTAVTFALPPLTPARPKNATTGEQSVADTRALPRKVDGKVSQKVKPGEQRLSEGCTSLMYACQQGLTGDILKELRQKPSAVHRRDRSNKSALHYCSSAQDIAAAASVAMVAPELIESADEDGFTPLHLAVIQGNLQLVNLLLVNGADVNALDNEGHSVVHWATVCGEVEALRAVLAAGADVSTPDINGGSPLHYAAQMCGANYEGKTARASAKLALEILNTLLNHPDTSVEVEDKDGRQPLLWAASAGSAKAVLALIKAGAHVESADKDGLTALHCAASRGHTECIDTLINLCGAHTDQIDSNGCTALHYAVTLGHADATSLLLKLDADPNRQDRKGRTPAHCGCAKGQMETVKILHTKKGNLWLRNAKGDLPVHDAASSGRRQLVQWLIQMKPKHINTTSNDGRTLLHIAAGHDNVDMCKLLLELGADINLLYRPSSKGAPLTPLDYALVKGYRSTAKYLQMQGGLPANKLRLSGRQQKILPDIDRVEPLKLTEKEELIDLKTSKRYIVYLNSNSESESQEDRTHRKSRHKRKGSHRGRRTSSCSDTVYLYRDGSNDISRSRSNAELHRSDQRSTKHRRSSSSSSASTTGSSSDSCCKHVRRKHKCYKKCNSKRSHSRDRHKDREREEPHDPKQQDAMKEYEFKYAEKKDAGPRKPGERCGKIILKQVHSGSSENDSPSNVGGRAGALKFSSERTARETHLGLPAGLQYGGPGTFDPSGGLGDFLDEPTSPRTPPRAEFNIRKESDTKSEGKSSDSSTTKKKKLKGTGKKTKLAKSTKKSDSPSEEEQAKPPSSTEVVTEAQVHQPPESMSKSTEDDGAATDATYTIEQRTRSDVEGLSETEDRAGKPRVTSKPVTETIEEVRDEHAVELVQQQTAATRVEVRKDRSKLKSAKSDSKSRSKSESSDKESAKVQQKPAVEEPLVPPAPPPSSPLVKEKTPEPVPEPPVPPKPEAIPVPEPQPEPQPVSLPQLETLPEVTEDRRESAVESQPLQGLEVDRGGGMGDDESLIAEESLPPLIEPEEPVQMETKPVPVPVEEEKPTPEESTESSPSKSSEETEPSSVVEEATEKPVPKTVDEPPAVVEEIPPVVEKPKPPEHPKERPKLRRSMESKMESVEEDTKMVAPVEPTKEGKDTAVPELLDQEKVDQTRGFFVSLDGTEDDEKKKKKIKKKPRLKEEEQQEQQSSKDQDSGFEPSPQAIRSKPSIFERPTHTATLPRRSAFTMVEERAVSSRPEGRKPGDKNAVNMTTVQQSIHRNIRSCRMEVSGMEGFVNRSDVPREKQQTVIEHGLSLDCMWVVTVADGWKIQLSFLKFKLERPNDCESNFVDVFTERTDLPSRLKNFCGSIADSVVSRSNVLHIRFFAEAAAINSTFSILFTAFREKAAGETCDDTEYDCEDATCISGELRCNGRINCRFRWDEDECQKQATAQSEHVIIIVIVFGLILGGMILLFLFNCSRKIIRDHKIIREHIRQSRESKLNELGRHSTKKLVDLDITKLPPPAFDKDPINVLESSSTTNVNNGQYYRDMGIGSVGGGSAGSGGGTAGPHMFSSRIDIKADPQDVLRGSYHEDALSRSGTLGRDGGGMCDMACQTRESLFQPVFKNKVNQSPNQLQNSIRFSTFGYESQQQEQQQLPAVTPPPPRVKHHHHHHHHHHGGGTLEGGTKSSKVNRIELEDLSPPGSGGYDDRGDDMQQQQQQQLPPSQHGHSHSHTHTHQHQHPHTHQKIAHERNLTETGVGPGMGRTGGGGGGGGGGAGSGGGSYGADIRKSAPDVIIMTSSH